jgi:hypothetical protein
MFYYFIAYQKITLYLKCHNKKKWTPLHDSVNHINFIGSHEFVGYACKERLWNNCSFHFVPHFEEQLPAVDVNSEFIFWGLDATFPQWTEPWPDQSKLYLNLPQYGEAIPSSLFESAIKGQSNSVNEPTYYLGLPPELIIFNGYPWLLKVVEF